MGDLLTPQKNAYDDKNNLMVNTVTLIESCLFTQIATAPSGAITSMYDSDDTTYYQFHTENSASPTESWVKWDFKSKPKLKNLYVYVEENNVQYMKLEGSNDNSAWTTLASGGANATPKNFIASNTQYRYYRMVTKGLVSYASYARVFTIKAVIQ